MPTISPNHIEMQHVIAWEITENSIDGSWFVKATFSDLQPGVFQLYEESIPISVRQFTATTIWNVALQLGKPLQETGYSDSNCFGRLLQEDMEGWGGGEQTWAKQESLSNSLWTLSNPDTYLPIN